MAFPRPLVAAMCVAGGIALAPLSPAGALTAWIVAAAIGAFRRWRIALVIAGVALASRAKPPMPERVVGTVGAPVVKTSRGVGASVHGDGVTVWVWADVPLEPGERIAVTGVVHEPRGFLDPAMPDRAAMMASRGADYEVTARAIERLGDDPSVVDRAWRAAAAVQTRWAQAIDQAGGDPVGAAALRGIVVGDRGDVPAELDQRWRVIGIYHVLSVSGLHLAVVAGLAFALLGKLVAASPLGGRCRPARWAGPPALVLAIAYTLVTGAQLATLRSLAVVVAMIVAAMLDRPVKLVDALGVAALVLLAWRPADLYDPSFQLSFVAALTLALRPSTTRRGIRGWLVHGATTSLWVSLTTAPITAYHFHQVAAGGIVGNLVLTPIVELVALPVGLAGLV
ncbi:MAG TPA: ComEC/Rec2 family competence protein, partial [Kofleriaceae bacterium]|nr:ComEC/Rec2 family competence protein [Kofleriaceae bacterium]